MNASIEFQGLWRHFAEKHVLCGLDLAVRPGEVFAADAAVVLLERYASAFRRTARRFSICADDAEEERRLRLRRRN